MTPSAFLGLVVVAPAIALALGALLAFIIGAFYVLYLQPLLEWLTRRGGGFLGRFIRWAVRPLTAFVKSFITRHVKLLMRSFATGVQPFVVVLDQLNDLTNRTQGTLADMSEQTYRAFWELRHRTVPRLITAALVPIRQTLTRHTSRLDQLEDLNRQVSVTIGSGLRALPWGAAGTYVGNFGQWWNSYRHLWNQFFHFAQPKLNELYNATVPGLQSDVARLVARADALAERLAGELIPRIAAVEQAALRDLPAALTALALQVEVIAQAIYGEAEADIRVLTERIAALETGLEGRVAALIAPVLARVEALEARLEDVLVPRIEALERGVADTAAAIRAEIRAASELALGRIEALERYVFGQLPGELADIRTAVDVLTEQVTGVTGAALAELIGRVRAIEAQLADLQIPNIEALTQRLADLERRVELEVLPRIAGLETEIRTALATVRVEIREAEARIVGRIADAEALLRDNVLPRIGALEAALLPAALGAAALAALRIVAPHLFCRNVTSGAQRVCGIDEDLWAQLLAGTLIWALVLDPRLIARAGQEVTEGMAGIWRATALHA